MKYSIQISEGESQTAGFISWKRLVTEVFQHAAEIKWNERVVRIELSERGINYFVTTERT